MAKSKCPVCGATIDLGENYTVGSQITYPNCGAKLKIIRRGRRIKLEEIKEE